MDDDEHIRALTKGMLENLEYKCDVAKNGEEAVHCYQRALAYGHPYDLVIMDLTVIGGMGGEQTFKRLHELDPRVQAVLTSGYDSDDLRRQCLGLGFRGYLTKPYRLRELGEIITKALGR